MKLGVYPSYVKLLRCWLRLLTRITYLSKLIGICALVAGKQLKLLWVYIGIGFIQTTCCFFDQHFYHCEFFICDMFRKCEFYSSMMGEQKNKKWQRGF
jgi:hypothetical protein